MFKLLKKSIQFILILCVWSCGQEIEKPTTFKPKVPSYFGGILPEPSYNKTTLDGIELGKKLFFDPITSSNNLVSCASCHHQNLAFSDDGKKISNAGVSGKNLHRNTPPLFNLAWQTGYFWDGGAKDLESQVFAPLQHPDEHNQDLKALIVKLQNHAEYPKLFAKVFNNEPISSQNISYALAQYERSLVSYKSIYDNFLQKKDSTIFSSTQKKGLLIFELHCEKCHKHPFLTDFLYHNNGIDTTFTDESDERVFMGRFRITNDSADLGKYKTPSLRNILLTAPYMHDGRFATLDDVFLHYTNQIKVSKTLAENLKTKITLSAEEKNALNAFFETLTDYEFIKNPTYSIDK